MVDSRSGVTPSSCPRCDKRLDAATYIKEGQTVLPKEGDFSLCMYCGQILVFDALGAVHDGDVALSELGDESVRQYILGLQRTIRRLRKN